MSKTTLPANRVIYKILTPSEWKRLCLEQETPGSALDQADGFIHFSTQGQVAETLAKHYAKAGDLILAEIPLTRLSSHTVRWETARGGDLFPHLYAPLQRAAIARHWPLRAGSDGRYALPDLTEAL